MSDSLASVLRGKKLLQEEHEAKINKMKKYSPIEIIAFYGCLENWLSDLIGEKIILTSYEVVTVDRKGLGKYYTTKFKLKIGEDEINFIPNKRIAVGTTGAIEMKTRKGKERYLLSEMWMVFGNKWFQNHL